MTERPLVFGILNLTPDSFSDGGTFYEYDLVSGSTDAANRIFFEAANFEAGAGLPLDERDDFVFAGGCRLVFMVFFYTR